MSARLDPRAPQPEPHAPEKPEQELRRHPRLELPVRCWIADRQRTVYLRVHDVSLGGLSVRAPVAFPKAGAVELRLELPGGLTVRARAEVVWLREGAELSGPRMGARFLEILEGEEELYKVLVRA